MEKKFYTIVDKKTGQELRGQFEGDNIADNEIEVEEKRTEVMDNPYFDFKTRTFYNGENLVKNLSQSDLIESLEFKINELNNLQRAELSETDFYIIRKMETGQEIPKEITQFRNNIREKYSILKQEITSKQEAQQANPELIQVQEA